MDRIETVNWLLIGILALQLLMYLYMTRAMRKVVLGINEVIRGLRGVTKEQSST